MAETKLFKGIEKHSFCWGILVRLDDSQQSARATRECMATGTRVDEKLSIDWRVRKTSSRRSANQHGDATICYSQKWRGEIVFRQDFSTVYPKMISIGETSRSKRHLSEGQCSTLAPLPSYSIPLSQRSRRVTPLSWLTTIPIDRRRTNGRQQPQRSRLWRRTKAKRYLDETRTSI